MSHCIQNKSDIERDSKMRYLHVGTIYLPKCDKIRGKEKHRINTVMVSIWLDQTVQRHYNSYCFVCFLLLCECIWTYKTKRNITLHPSKAYFSLIFPWLCNFILLITLKISFIQKQINLSAFTLKHMQQVIYGNMTSFLRLVTEKSPFTYFLTHSANPFSLTSPLLSKHIYKQKRLAASHVGDKWSSEWCCKSFSSTANEIQKNITSWSKQQET